MLQCDGLIKQYITRMRLKAFEMPNQRQAKTPHGLVRIAQLETSEQKRALEYFNDGAEKKKKFKK